MRKITYYCDRCGKQVQTDIVKILATHYYTQDNNTDVPDDEDEGAILCESCLDIIDAAITQAMKLVALPDEKPKKKAWGGQNKKQLDLGKIAALRNAGWSLDKIGEEFSVSGTTIANHLPEAMEFLASKKEKENYDD